MILLLLYIIIIMTKTKVNSLSWNRLSANNTFFFLFDLFYMYVIYMHNVQA